MMRLVRPLPESKGTYSQWRQWILPCSFCRGVIDAREWRSASGRWRGEQYCCRKCGRVWWADDPNS